jgi:hypothetical protein
MRATTSTDSYNKSSKKSQHCDCNLHDGGRRVRSIIYHISLYHILYHILLYQTEKYDRNRQGGARGRYLFML